MKKTLLASALVTALFGSIAFAEVSQKAVLTNYANIAHAGYEDSLITAKSLKKAIDVFVGEPTDKTLAAAKEAWVVARAPYQQTEAYRFANAIVDDWEGKVNSWPLDEGLIDYVNTDSYGKESDENPHYTANIIANKTLIVAGKTVDTSKFTAELLTEKLQETEGIESNVATGYHAIEFLLWGQDLNGTKAGAGARKASDYDTKSCTNGNCERRGAYLQAVTNLLISDLSWMTMQWDKKGKARTALIDGDMDKGISVILTGMGSLSYGELAGERMKLGLMLHDPEEEHDCFSDNTHNSHFYDAKGIQNVYLGKYSRIDGTIIEGASLSDLVAESDTKVNTSLTEAIDHTMAKMKVLVETAEAGEAYDQMIGEGNKEGNQKVLDAVNALTAQAKAIEKAVAAMKLPTIGVEGSDSLDNPEKVGAEG